MRTARRASDSASISKSYLQRTPDSRSNSVERGWAHSLPTKLPSPRSIGETMKAQPSKKVSARGTPLQIRHVILKVDDLDKALAFYTNVLGFVKTRDDRRGNHRWLTVSSRNGPKAAELVLEPNSHRPARVSQKALFDAVFPAAILSTNDIAAEYQRLKALGIKFRGK